VLATRWKLERRESAAAGGVASWSAAADPVGWELATNSARQGRRGEAAGRWLLASAF